jgi:hypothetical protein
VILLSRKISDSFFSAHSSQTYKMAERYERVYDVTLLDDLHNYFPAILYNHEVFRNVSDLLLYVRERTQRRFNLFDYGRRQYESSMPMPPLRTPAAYGRRPATNPIVEEVRVEFTPNAPATNLSTLLPLLRTLNTLNIPLRARAVGGAAAYEDVVVHASQDVINGASTESTLEADAEDNCTICQDRMRQGELVRKLTACEHVFHRACIDNWLLTRSVICPTCRHDVRNPTRTRITSPLMAPVAAAAALPPLDIDPAVDEMLPRDLINILFGRSLN